MEGLLGKNLSLWTWHLYLAARKTGPKNSKEFVYPEVQGQQWLWSQVVGSVVDHEGRTHWWCLRWCDRDYQLFSHLSVSLSPWAQVDYLPRFPCSQVWPCNWEPVNKTWVEIMCPTSRPNPWKAFIRILPCTFPLPADLDATPGELLKLRVRNARKLRDFVKQNPTSNPEASWTVTDNSFSLCWYIQVFLLP